MMTIDRNIKNDVILETFKLVFSYIEKYIEENDKKKNTVYSLFTGVLLFLGLNKHFHEIFSAYRYRKYRIIYHPRYLPKYKIFKPSKITVKKFTHLQTLCENDLTKNIVLLRFANNIPKYKDAYILEQLSHDHFKNVKYVEFGREFNSQVPCLNKSKIQYLNTGENFNGSINDLDTSELKELIFGEKYNWVTEIVENYIINQLIF